MPKKTLKDLKLGLKKSLTREIEFRWTIAAYSRKLPAVLSTPAMIGWMESAAAFILKPHLPPGAISVGTHINVSHRAPTGVGTHVTFRAELTRIGNNRYTFAVSAHAGRKLLGEGTVQRAIVLLPAFRDRFQTKRK
jgi:fluoroacetyl-CoA thioesterase